MKILFLVLFFLFTSLSCKQNPRSMLSSPPKTEEGITNNNTGSSNTNSGGNIDNDLNSGYGCYDVYILGNGDSVQTVKYRISDTDKLLEAYSNMILNTDQSPKFKLSKKDNNTETYTFDSNLNLVKGEANKNAGTSAISKKFKGVCLVIIYPDATTAAAPTAKSSLLGNYTIAGIYTEMPAITKNTSRAMANSTTFQKAGYDELIVLRTDIATTNNNNIDYRADILFNDDKWISVYNYDPNRTFMKQNTNYNFVKATP